jgi:hypothetical protein
VIIVLFPEVLGGWHLPLILVRSLPLESRSLPSHIDDVLLARLSPPSLMVDHGRILPSLWQSFLETRSTLQVVPQDLNFEKTCVGHHDQHWIAQH